MKKVLLLLLVISESSFGCSDLNWNWSNIDWLEKPNAIYYGMIVSVSAPKSFKKDGEIDPFINMVSSQTRFMGADVELKVFETLKGKDKPLVKANLKGCTGGVSKYRQEVVLYRVGGQWHAKSYQQKDTESVAYFTLKSLTKVQGSSGLP